MALLSVPTRKRRFNDIHSLNLEIEKHKPNKVWAIPQKDLTGRFRKAVVLQLRAMGKSDDYIWRFLYQWDIPYRDLGNELPR